MSALVFNNNSLRPGSYFERELVAPARAGENLVALGAGLMGALASVEQRMPTGTSYDELGERFLDRISLMEPPVVSPAELRQIATGMALGVNAVGKAQQAIEAGGSV